MIFSRSASLKPLLPLPLYSVVLSDRLLWYRALFRSDPPRQVYSRYGMQGPSQVQPVLQLEAASKCCSKFFPNTFIAPSSAFCGSGHCGSHAQWQVRSDGHRHLLSLLLIPASSVGCRARSPFFSKVTQNILDRCLDLYRQEFFIFSYGSTLKYGVRQVSPPARQIHSTSHRQTLLPDLLPQKSCVLF